MVDLASGSLVFGFCVAVAVGAVTLFLLVLEKDWICDLGILVLHFRHIDVKKGFDILLDDLWCGTRHTS